MLLGLAARPDVDLSLLVSAQWVDQDGKLDPRSPLRDLPTCTFPMPENRTERLWKLIGHPRMDGYLPPNTDWLYAPMETYLPVNRHPVAVTIQDIQAFETDLPWSNTLQHRWFRQKWQGWISRAFRDSHVIFAGSAFTKQRMVTLLGADPRKIVVVGNGVESTFFDIAQVAPESLDMPLPDPYILVIGGLRAKKGAVATLAVAAQLARQRPALRIVVVGDSEPHFAPIAAALPNVHLLGLVPDHDLPRWVRAAAALLFLSHYEGFGIPAVEAMAAGTPVVCAHRASLPEVVGDAGFLVEPDASAHIADILLQLVDTPSLRAHHAQLGYQQAQQFTWSACVARALNAFQTFA
jgi:glycosyltransferase involved in cell wall biosynthesis